MSRRIIIISFSSSSSFVIVLIFDGFSSRRKRLFLFPYFLTNFLFLRGQKKRGSEFTLGQRDKERQKREEHAQEKELRSAKERDLPPFQLFLRRKQIISQSGRRPIFKRLIHFSVQFLGCSIDRFLIESHRSVSSGVVEPVLRVQLGVKSKGQKTRFDRLFF